MTRSTTSLAQLARAFLVILMCGLLSSAAWALSATSVSLTSSVNPAYDAQTTTLTARLTPSAATGIVRFWNGTTFIGSGTLSAGVANLNVSFAAAGTQSVTAEYTGDATYATSRSVVLAQVITARTPTTVVLSSSINPTYAAQGTTLRASVAPATATGLVQVFNGTTFIGSGNLSGGVVSVNVAFSAAGTQNLTAKYLGDLTKAPSTSAVFAQNVTARTVTTTVLTSSVNPSALGQTTTLRATVTPATATGFVRFWNGTTQLTMTQISAGVATANVSFATAGTQNLTADYYLGDLTNAPSTSAVLVQTVNGTSATATTTTLVPSINPVITGQVLDLIASVSPATAGGSVTFKDGTTTLGTASLSSGLATWPVSFTVNGTHSLTAVYGGDSSNLTSTSSAVSLAVNAPTTLPAPPVSPTPVLNYEYDANGNATKVTQAPAVAGFAFATQSAYDALNRAKSSTDAKNGLTQFGYDGQDRLTAVTDPRSLATQSPRNGLGDTTQLVSPDTGTASMTYDAAGNLKTRTDSRGVLATYSYDALNRPTSLVYSQSGQTSQSLAWVYDQTGTGFSNGIGRLTSTTHAGGSSQYGYDPQGRVISDTQSLSAATGANTAAVSTKVAYGYDGAGHVTSITYPSGRVLSITFVGGKPSSLALAKDATSTPVSLLSQVQFSPFGGLQSWQWQMANGAVEANGRVIDSSGRLVRYRLGQFIRDLTYDAADRIAAYTHYDWTTGTATALATSINQSFGYDELGRLTGVSMGGSGWTIAYDANGNRTSVSLNGVARVYTTAPTSNRLTAISNPVRNLGYDNAGNVTNDSASYTSSYNLAGRLSTMVRGGITSTFTYDAMGRRVRKFSSSGATSAVIFAYDLAGHLIGEYNAAGAAIREYVWLGDTPVAVFSPDTVATNAPLVFFIHADHLDTPRLVLDRNNGIRWRWLAEPFGTTAPETNPQGLGAFTFNLRFPGQYADAETGLNYNFFRDFDSTTGRYVQSDPIGLNGGINTYSYVGGNPLGRVDPDGLRWVCIIPLGCVYQPDAPSLDPDFPRGVGPNQMATSGGSSSARGSSSASNADQCKAECDATASRTEAMVAAYSWAGIPIGGAGTNPIPWNNFNMPAGMSRGGREYGEFMRTYYPKNYGYSTPGGALVVEHPFGHPDQPGPAHHACPHFHAKNAAGVEKIFAYRPGG